MKDRFGRCVVCGRREECCPECHRAHDHAWAKAPAKAFWSFGYCHRGHELTDAIIYTRANGSRACRLCKLHLEQERTGVKHPR